MVSCSSIVVASLSRFSNSFVCVIILWVRSLVISCKSNCCALVVFIGDKVSSMLFVCWISVFFILFMVL